MDLLLLEVSKYSILEQTLVPSFSREKSLFPTTLNIAELKSNMIAKQSKRGSQIILFGKVQGAIA